LFLGKSTKTAATRAALLDFIMHQIVCRLALHPRAHWGAYSTPPDYLAVCRGPTYKWRGEQKRKGMEDEKGGEGGSWSCALGRTDVGV